MNETKNDMKTTNYLKENRVEVINFFNNEVSNYWTISLKDFMTDLVDNFRKISIKEEYTRMDLMGNLKEAKSRLGCYNKVEIEAPSEKSFRGNVFLSEASKGQLPSSMR